MTLLVIGSLIFIIAGFYIYSTESNLKFIGIIGILFFGLTGVTGIRRLIKPKAALIINSKGITDNSTVTSVGFIPWKDVIGFQPVKVTSNNFLVVQVKNPTTYIDNSKNMLTKQSLKYNYSSFNSPIAIGEVTLPLKLTEVEKILLNALKKYNL
ncbi:STM3941 family protein [uncultured Kordia sp.]|uniref:STM3941 family protein n=1 Tax=uncultured Kordia sp. TaxID=507699 RepID=UPI002615994C|nr:STM3941 family protein [uncultured Kordia sp.]